MSCGCNLEYITKGTTQKSSNICETRDRVVHKAIKKHDKICACGAFEFVQQEEEKRKPRKTALHTEAKKTCHAPRAPKTPTSSKTPTLPQTLPYPKIPGQPSKHPLEHLKRPIDGFSDDDYKENIFKGMKRKW